jgi:HECT-domain (ubiquitin-transferase)
LEDDSEFLLMGLVLGLAVYNSVLLDFPLPLALYRKLLGQSCTLRDLQDMEPQLGKSLSLLLDYDGEGMPPTSLIRLFTSNPCSHHFQPFFFQS